MIEMIEKTIWLVVLIDAFLWFSIFLFAWIACGLGTLAVLWFGLRERADVMTALAAGPFGLGLALLLVLIETLAARKQ